MFMVKKRKKADQPSDNPWPDKLRALRESRDPRLTQRAAAKLCGVTPRTWISWENNQFRPGRLALRLLRKKFPELFKS
jgi:DNA-binding XRE family transcriptional regulator